MTTEELMHYGVLGMKWGVHRAKRASKVNTRLQKKATEYDLKSIKRAKKAEKLHSKLDLDAATKLGVKSEKLAKKALVAKKKADSSTDANEKFRYERKAAKNEYKSKKIKAKANQITKVKGYGSKSLSQLKKSDKYAAKAAKVRLKIANNNMYINKMRNKASAIPKEERASGYAFCNELFKN